MTAGLLVVRERFPLARVHRSATVQATVRETAVLVLVADDGVRGLGEVAPLPGYSDESLDASLAAIAGFDARALAHALAAGDLETADEATRELPPSARCGLETAFLDAAARRSGRSLAVHLGAPHDASRAPCRLVDLDRPLASLPDASAYKLKVTAGDSAAAIRALRLAHPDAELRVDANRSLDPGRDAALVDAMAQERVAFVEEPFGAPDATFACALPIALDESLRGLSPSDVRGLLGRRPDAHLVLKPTTLGLVRTMLLAAHARELGRRAILSHTFEGAVGYSACAALATALPEPSPGLDADYGPVSGGLAPACLVDGRLVVPGSPGLGLPTEAFGR